MAKTVKAKGQEPKKPRGRPPKVEPKAKPAAKKSDAKKVLHDKAKLPAKKTGRPTVYDAAVHPALAEAWATAGRTDKQIAVKLGISEATLNTWKKAHPEFLESLKQGKAEPDDRVEACLLARATGYDHPAVKIFMPAGAKAPVYAKYIEHCPPDVTAILAWLNNRRPDRWRNRHEVTGAEGGPLEVVTLTPEERDARLKEILERAKP